MSRVPGPARLVGSLGGALETPWTALPTSRLANGVLAPKRGGGKGQGGSSRDLPDWLPSKIAPMFARTCNGPTTV
jgi:hypothetical protein